jgi:hypothetical protein
MCLEIVTHGPDPQEQGEGYKVFRKLPEGELTSLYVFFDDDEFYSFPTNTWIADSSQCSLSDEGKREYQTGFHLFANQKDAELKAGLSDTYVVRKVKYRNVTAKGKQIIYSWFDEWDNAPAIVAREIFIEEPKEQ